MNSPEFVAVPVTPHKQSSIGWGESMPAGYLAPLVDLDRLLSALVLGRTNHLEAWSGMFARISEMDGELIDAAATLILEKMYWAPPISGGLEDGACMGTLLCGLSVCLEKGARPSLRLDDLLRCAHGLPCHHGVNLCTMSLLATSSLATNLAKRLKADSATRKRKCSGDDSDGGAYCHRPGRLLKCIL